MVIPRPDIKAKIEEYMRDKTSKKTQWELIFEVDLEFN
jgi:hypothetical protein